MKLVAKIVATVAFVGYAPVAPGTAGSAAAALILWLIPPLAPVTGIAVLLALTAGGIWASSQAEHIYGHDASKIVIDEFAGYFLAVLLVPKTWLLLLCGFLAFRFFDIFKPWPIRCAERLKGGFGVMADDLLAGLATNILLRLGLWIVNGL
jgi:phosphatidylglycerophosphatase A